MTIISEIDTVFEARLPFYGLCLLLGFTALYCVLMYEGAKIRWFRHLALILSISSGVLVIGITIYSFPNVEPEYKAIVTDMDAVTEDGYEIIDILNISKGLYSVREIE